MSETVTPMSDTGTPMPRYRCHKEVWALKIKAVEYPAPPAFTGPVCKGAVAFGSACGHCERCKWYSDNAGLMGTVRLIFEHGAIEVNRDYMAKHKPEAGGYYVVYDDGYKSFSPGKAFEDGYTRIGPPKQPPPLILGFCAVCSRHRRVMLTGTRNEVETLRSAGYCVCT